MQTALLSLALPDLPGCSSPSLPLPPLFPSPPSSSLTLQSEVHDAGVQGVHLGVHVSADVDEVHRCPSHGGLGEGAGAQVRQGMQGWGLGRGRRVWGEMCLGLDLVVQGNRLQGQGHQRLGWELGDGQAAVGHGHRGGMGQHGGLGLPWLAGASAAFWPVRDQLVQLLCRQVGEVTHQKPPYSFWAPAQAWIQIPVILASLLDSDLSLFIYEMASHTLHRVVEME